LRQAIKGENIYKIIIVLDRRKQKRDSKNVLFKQETGGVDPFSEPNASRRSTNVEGCFGSSKLERLNYDCHGKHLRLTNINTSCPHPESDPVQYRLEEDEMKIDSHCTSTHS
jgi:hypothetical protein